MEGVPRLPFLSFELKKGQADSDLSSPLQKLIRDHFQENPDTFVTELKEFEGCRHAAINASKDQQGCVALKKYFCQLQLLLNRLPRDEKKLSPFTFTWTDIYAGITFSVSDFKYEMASILYNIAALHSQLGQTEHRQSPDGMKIVCTHYQCAAWALQQINKNYMQPRGTDMAPDLVELFEIICLAQAQECILEKSMVDNRKSANTAKIAAQIAAYYKIALQMLEKALKPQEEESLGEYVGPRLLRHWRKVFEFKNFYYGAITLLFQGMNSEELQKMGQRITYYQAATEKLTEASKVYKGIPEQEVFADAISFCSDVFGGKLNSSQKENEFVYHEIIPPLGSLPDIKGAVLAKGTGFDCNDPDIAGPDLFSRLISMETHATSSMYSEEKAKLLRTVSEKIESKDDDLNQFMTVIQADELVLSLDAQRLPEELVERCASFSVQNDPIGTMTGLMSRLSDLSIEVEEAVNEISEIIQTDEEKEKSYQKSIGKRPPSMLFAEIKRELEKFKKAHSKASESNNVLHKAASAQLPNLSILAKPLGEIQNQLPSLSSMRGTVHESSIMEMDRLVKKVEEMKRQRVSFAHQLREALQTDDLTKKLATLPPNCDLEAVFSEEIKKHDHKVQLIEQNLSAQEKILRALTEANTRFAETRRATFDLISARNSSISALIHAYDAYEDLIQKMEHGIDFYKKLAENLQKLRQKAKGVFSVQNEEREQAMKKLDIKKLYSDEETVQGPKLKDYLMARKGASSTPGPGYRPAPLGAENSEIINGSCSLPQAYASAPVSTPPVSYMTNPRLPLDHVTSMYGNMNMNERQNPYHNPYTSQVDATLAEQRLSYYDPSERKTQLPSQGQVSAPSAQQQRPDPVPQISRSDSFNSTDLPLPSYGNTVPTGVYNLTNTHTALGGAYYSGYTPYTGPPGYGQPSSQEGRWPPGPQGYNPNPIRMPENSQASTGPSVRYTSIVSGSISALDTGVQNFRNTPQDGHSANPAVSAPMSSQSYQTYGQYSQYDTSYLRHPSPSQAGGQAASSVVSQAGYHSQPMVPFQQAGMPQFSQPPAGAPHPSGYYQTTQAGQTSSQRSPSQYGAQLPSQYTVQQPGVTQAASGQVYQQSYTPAQVATPPQVPVSTGAASYQQVVPNQPSAKVWEQASSYQNPYGYPTASIPRGSVSQAFTPYSQYNQYISHAGGQAATSVVQSLPYSNTGMGANQSSQPTTHRNSSELSSVATVRGQAPQSSSYSYLPGPGIVQARPSSQPGAATSYNSAYNSFQSPGNAANYPAQPTQAQSTVPVGVNTYMHQPSHQHHSYSHPLNQNPTPVAPYNSQTHPGDAQLNAYGSQGLQNQMYTQPLNHQTSIAYPGNLTSQTLVAGQHPMPVVPVRSNSVLDSSNVPATDGILQPTPAGSASSSPAHRASRSSSVVSNVDLLAELDINVKPSRASVQQGTAFMQPPMPSSENVAKTFDLQSFIHTKAAITEPKNSNIFEDKEILTRFAIETDKFEKFVDGLTKRSLNGPTPLEVKWKEIQDAQERESSKSKISVARCYPMKNKQPDILPFDHNRITLPSTKDDYINASNLGALVHGGPTVIATQCPLPCTFVDFWVMIWEQQTEVVICLLTDAELLTSNYFPRERATPMDFGCFSVALQSSQNKPLWMERVLKLTNKDLRTSRYVVHLQFSGWGSTDFPSSPMGFLAFVNESAHFWRQQRNHCRPLIAHCLSGAGKTGVFAVILAVILEAAATGIVPDVFRHCVAASLQRRSILRDRDYLHYAYKVANAFCHDVLRKHHFDFSDGDTEPVVETTDVREIQDVLPEFDPHSVSQTEVIQEPAVDATEHQDSIIHTEDIASGSSSMSDSPKHGLLESSLDPSQFTLGSGLKKSKKQAMKERFLTGQSNLGRMEPDPLDPLSILDPLWSSKKFET